MKKKNISVTTKTPDAKTSAETIAENSASFGKTWFWRIFHTLLMFFGSYAVIVGTTLEIPVVIPFILGGLGFSVTSAMSNAEYIVAFCAGLFLTLWLVIIDYLIVRLFWRTYKKNIKKTVHTDKDGKVKY